MTCKRKIPGKQMLAGALFLRLAGLLQFVSVYKPAAGFPV